METTDPISAKFNSGLLQTQRIDKILSHLNFCKNNPLATDSDLMEYNYKLWFNELGNLHDEIDAYMDDIERKDCIRFRQVIEDYIRDVQVYTNPRNPNCFDSKGWRKIKGALELYERFLKRAGFRHQILNSQKESAGRI